MSPYNTGRGVANMRDGRVRGLGVEWADREWKASSDARRRYASHPPFSRDKGFKILASIDASSKEIYDLIRFAKERWHELQAAGESS